MKLDTAGSARHDSGAHQSSGSPAWTNPKPQSRIPAPSQPPLLPRQPVRLDAVADAELADRFGEVVAHGAVREVQALGDFAGGQAFAREAQQLAFSIVEG